jgi:calcium/proton exchanger cax
VEEGEEEEEAEEPMLTLTAAILWLTGITVLVAVSSEYLTGSIEEVSHTWGLSQSFLGFIILPIAGNACEHITAVFVAYRCGNWVGVRRVGCGGEGRRPVPCPGLHNDPPDCETC